MRITNPCKRCIVQATCKICCDDLPAYQYDLKRLQKYCIIGASIFIFGQLPKLFIHNEYTKIASIVCTTIYGFFMLCYIILNRMSDKLSDEIFERQAYENMTYGYKKSSRSKPIKAKTRIVR